ncbi:TolC family protein [Marinoscillum sp. MHG1-6]|uniref:TolC family protein n=1 Tax=Marinoscillum sp. MHG1-6 TaxID=2959627 RepID=UPI002157293E|nr:TolC family protein [Marinoscillum sp. MHG1-6]
MNNKYSLLTVALLALISFNLIAQEHQLTLLDVIDLAKENSTAAKSAVTRKENRYWQYRTYRANYNPSLNLNGNLPGYSRLYKGIEQNDGTTNYTDIQQVSSTLNLGLKQDIALTGGSISVNSSLNQFGNLIGDGFEDQYRTTLINVRLEQPIFGFNELKWNKRIEPLKYEESKRSFVEDMERVSQEATTHYFNYLDAQISLQIATFNQAINDSNYRIQKGRFNIGTVTKDDLLQFELQKLSSERAVIQANLDLQIARLQLRSYIGITEGSELKMELIAPGELPEFDIPLEKALEFARANRSDFLQYERRRIEAQRDVSRAQSQRFETNLNASFGYNQAANNLPEAYVDPNGEQVVNVSLRMPILDWGRSKSRIETAKANQQLTEYTLDQEIQNFEQEIISLVGRFEVYRANVEISRRTDEVAQERYDVTQNRYLGGKATVTDLTLAQGQKDEAKRGYLNALRQFWNSYFELRRLTLYDFLNDELLYTEND